MPGLAQWTNLVKKRTVNFKSTKGKKGKKFQNSAQGKKEKKAATLRWRWEMCPRTRQQLSPCRKEIHSEKTYWSRAPRSPGTVLSPIQEGPSGFSSSSQLMDVVGAQLNKSPVPWAPLSSAFWLPSLTLPFVCSIWGGPCALDISLLPSR